LELQEVADYVLRRQIKERKAIIEAELEPIRVKEWRAYEQCNTEFRKQERYCKEQRDVLRALEDLDAKERIMYELDHRKDQVMTRVSRYFAGFLRGKNATSIGADVNVINHWVLPIPDIPPQGFLF
jgi:hypothetical protein